MDDCLIIDLTKSKYGYMTYTKNGELLRSIKEIIFYNLLEKYGIDCKVGLSYPNSLKKYDFYIPLFDEYIEIKHAVSHVLNIKTRGQIGAYCERV